MVSFSIANVLYAYSSGRKKAKVNIHRRVGRSANGNFAYHMASGGLCTQFGIPECWNTDLIDYVVGNILVYYLRSRAS